MRYSALICAPVDFTYLRSFSQKYGKSWQTADACSSQIVVKIRGFTTKDLLREKQRFSFRAFSEWT